MLFLLPYPAILFLLIFLFTSLFQEHFLYTSLAQIFPSGYASLELNPEMSHLPLKLSACLCRSNSHQRESRIHFLQAHEIVRRVGEMDMGSRWSVIHPVLPSLTLDFRIGSYTEHWRSIVRKHNPYPFFPLEGRKEHYGLSWHDS